MASHNNTELEKPTAELATTDSESDVEIETDEEDEARSDIDEEELNQWLVPTYKRLFFAKRPMKEPLKASWDLSISDADVEKLKVGFKSQSMDDKWDLLVEDPDESGGISIHIIRNWLQEECYILHIVPKPSGDHDGESAKVQSITWEGNKGRLQCGAEQAQKEAVMLCRGWLGCEFDALPHYPSSVFWDPSAYKKLGAPATQPGSDVAGSSAEKADDVKKVDKSLKLHVMSLGPASWNEIGNE